MDTENSRNRLIEIMDTENSRNRLIDLLNGHRKTVSACDEQIAHISADLAERLTRRGVVTSEQLSDFAARIKRAETMRETSIAVINTLEGRFPEINA